MKKLCLILGLALCFGGCAGAPHANDAVDKCLFQNEPAKVSVDYEGQSVGFCCNNCKAKFEEMSDTEKKAALAARK